MRQVVVVVLSVLGQLLCQLRGGLRVHIHEDGSIANLKASDARKVRKALHEALEFWSGALKVRSEVDSVVLDRQCEGPGIWTGRGCPADRGCSSQTTCGEVEVPRAHLGPCLLCNQETGQCREEGRGGGGVAGVDLILYVSSKTSSLCSESSTLSHASHCQQEPDLDRPTGGHLNICPDNLPSHTAHLLTNIKHELLHVLGFSVKLYAFFRDRAGQPRTQRRRDGRPPLHSRYFLHLADNTTVARLERRNWRVGGGGEVSKTVHMLVTPRVRREARRHFRCSRLEGGELEDQGDLGTSLTHWEKRVFGDEAMTGNHQELQRAGRLYIERKMISRMTLAVLHDSGWYNVVFSKADSRYSWGKHLGCAFVMKSCLEFIESHNRIQPYCVNQTSFTQREKKDCRKKDSLKFCNLVKYGEVLPREFQNLPGPGDREDLGRWGGGMWLADFCPTEVTMISESC